MSSHKSFNESVYVIGGIRSPQLKTAKYPGPYKASDLAVHAAKYLLLKYGINSNLLDEVIIGCVMPEIDEANIARQVAIRIGCSESISAWTVQRNCASGMQALDSAMQSIRSGRAELVLAGGTEAMSHAPMLFNEKMIKWMADWFSSKGTRQKLSTLFKLSPSIFKPVFGLLKGLKDPLVELSMGQTAEILAWRFGISRNEMDLYAYQSHNKLATAIEQGIFADEIYPLFNHGQAIRQDTGLRSDTTPEKLASLNPVFDKPDGQLTAGNSAQVSDGATMMLLASKKTVQKYKLPVLGKLIDTYWTGLDPAQMGLGPAFAIPGLLNRMGMKLDDIDYWEINEAFASQVLACVKALADEEFCRNELDLARPVGHIDESRLNIHGGGISQGHPVGASGARIVLHLMNTLKQNKAHRGIASLCVGGGQGGALMVEAN